MCGFLGAMRPIDCAVIYTSGATKWSKQRCGSQLLLIPGSTVPFESLYFLEEKKQRQEVILSLTVFASNTREGDSFVVTRIPYNELSGLSVFL